MLTCIACSRQPGGGGPRLHEPPEDEDAVDGVGVSEAATPSTRLAIKALTAQIKDMALKASGAYRHCKPCTTRTTTAGATASRTPRPPPAPTASTTRTDAPRAAARCQAGTPRRP